MLAVVAAALTFAYIGRFWMLLFFGPSRAETAAASVVLVAPVAVLAAVAVLGGLVVAPFSQLAAALARSRTARPSPWLRPTTSTPGRRT